MIKVSEIKYTRPNKDELLASIEQYKERLINANSAKEFSAIFDQFNEEMEDINTNMEIANIRFTQDTRDEFYQNEKDYLDEISPEISVAITSLSQLVYYSKFRAELEEIYPKVLFTNMELEIKANDERLIEDRIQESKLVTRYTKLMSGIIIDFNGEKLTPAAIKKYFTNPNRELRKSAYEAFGKAMKTNGEEIDDIYDQLVAIRTRMGVTLGYKEGFAPLGYLQMCRNCYDKEDIAKFRANVKKYLVPLCSELHNKIKDSFGWDKVHLYDNEIFTVNEPKPQGTTEEIFDKTASIYNEMSPKTIELFSRMRECECFDVLSREGKWGGGYCTELPKYKLPFILSNFNGSLDDIGTLTHEFGHALEFDAITKTKYAYICGLSYETAECHSMSMEFLVYPWIDKLFGNATADYKLNHIGSAISFIPYGTIVDYFQQTVYDNPDMTPSERNEFYAKIENEFMPYMTSEGITAFSEGRRWQRQAHIFESPFYYIDYCLAQLTAFQFLALSMKDYKGALEKYFKFVSICSTKTYTQIIEECGLTSPFEEQTFKDIVETVRKQLSL